MDYNFAIAVTPHATTANVYDAFLVGGAGDVACKTAAGDDVIITCVAGQYVPVAVQLIYAVNTDATAITGLRK